MAIRTVRTAAALLGAFALGCAALPLPEQTPTSVSPVTPGAGDRRVVDQVILVTDASGTMYQNESFPEAKAITRSLISALPDDRYEAGLVGFGGTARSGAPLASFNRATLSQAGSDLEILGDYDGWGGETPYRHVLSEIGTSLEGKSGRSAIVMVSDGVPDYQPRAVQAAKALSTARGGQVCFHAIQTGSEEMGEQNLREIASQFSCGSFAKASSLGSAGALQDKVRSIMYETGTVAPPPMAPVADACSGVIRLRGINFGFDRADVTDDSAVVLDVAADQLKQCPNITVRIDGHTDSTGPEEYNLGLSRRRAEAVKGFFVNAGVSASRLTTRGLGEGEPIASNSTRDGRAQNRRVELIPQN